MERRGRREFIKCTYSSRCIQKEEAVDGWKNREEEDTVAGRVPKKKRDYIRLRRTIEGGDIEIEKGDDEVKSEGRE